MATPISPTYSRITIDYQICHEQTVVRGLRYPVWQVLELLVYLMTTGRMPPDTTLATGAA